MSAFDLNWHVRLVLDNEQHLQERAFELAREALKDEHPRAMLRDTLKDFVEELVYGEDGTSSDMPMMAAELVGCAMSHVDWYDLAVTYLQNVAEMDEYTANTESVREHYGESSR